MKRGFVTAFIAGIVFGFGLIVSGMSDPRNVIGFLSILQWEHFRPALALVMGGAVITHATLLFLGARLGISPPATAPKRPVDGKLIGGAILFGTGWGLAGYCPGPALVASATGVLPTLVSLAGLVLGIRMADAWLRARRPPALPAGGSPGDRGVAEAPSASACPSNVRG